MLNAVGLPLLRHAPVEDAEMMLDWNGYRKRRLADLSEQEILALAVSNEEEDHAIYRGLAEGLRENYPASTKVFDEMAQEESHRRVAPPTSLRQACQSQTFRVTLEIFRSTESARQGRHFKPRIKLQGTSQGFLRLVWPP